MALLQLAQTLTRLTGNDKLRLLARLSSNVGVAARGAYVEAGGSEELASKQLRGYNEIQLIIMSELEAAVDSSLPARTADDVSEALRHWASLTGVNEGLEWACRMTLERQAVG